jgi:transposase InsO family protein
MPEIRLGVSGPLVRIQSSRPLSGTSRPSWQHHGNKTAPNQRWVGDTTEFVIGENAKLSGGDSRSVFPIRRRLGFDRRLPGSPSAARW